MHDVESKTSNSMPDQSASSDRQRDSNGKVEKISFLLSTLLLLAILGGTSWLWVRDRNQGPPQLQVTSSVEKRQGQYYIPFKVSNTGGETAARVQVIVELRIDGQLMEWGDQQIDFLSSQEEAEGAFILTRDPSGGELTVRAASYQLP